MSMEELLEEKEKYNSFLESIDYYENKLSYAQEEWRDMLNSFRQSVGLVYAGMEGRLSDECGDQMGEAIRQSNVQRVEMDNLREDLARVGAAASTRIKELQDAIDALQARQENE